MITFIEKIEKKAEVAKQSGHIFMDTCSVYYHNPNENANGFVIMMPTLYYWGKPKSENSGTMQLSALKELKDFINIFNLLLPHFTTNQRKQIEGSQISLINLIEKKTKAPRSIETAKSFIEAEIKKHLALLNLLKTNNVETFIIPDTNSIVTYPDPISYKEIANSIDFHFILTPTVTKELDELKITHRNDGFREKVNSAIKRIKGYRNQGSLIKGVIYQKTIRIKAIANEPSFENLFFWLDKDNLDDRLIASVLEIIIANPNNNIILVTGDINLQNKAELAKINYAEIE